MTPAIWAAKTGLDAQQTRMSVTSNNLANVSTSGYKKSRGVFEDLLYQNVRQVGASTSQDTQAPSGLSLATGKMFTQGGINQTGNSLDLAIQGRGFFQVLLPDGTLGYTRDGNFQTNSQGQVVTSSGYLLQPSLTIPSGAQSITIGSDGVVIVTQSGQPTATQVGTIQVSDFVNPAGLQPRGENLLVESSASGTAQTSNPGLNGLGSLTQGALEGSNVNVVEELVNMIETQRAYEMNSKAIQTTD